MMASTDAVIQIEYRAITQKRALSMLNKLSQGILSEIPNDKMSISIISIKGAQLIIGFTDKETAKLWGAKYSTRL